ncbi:MAG TPA: glycosyltransferase [Methylomirabilota bacterium]|nr:glycosyltransferase [Methylomirabilota bacterium]
MSPRVPVLELVVSTQPGGGPQHVLDLATALRARGWRPIVGGPRDGALFDRFAAASIETVALRTDRLRPATLLRLVRLIRRRGIGLVHSHGKGAGLYGRLAARLLRVPAVHTFHGIHFERYGAGARATYLGMERRLARWTRVIVNVSRAQEAEGLALRLFTPAQSRVVLNGVDAARLNAAALDPFDARKALELETEMAVVGCAARFDEVKHLDLLLRAVALPAARGATLVLIGRGPEERPLRALAETLGVAGRVRFAGEIADAARLFRAFDVYAAPSRKEGMPLAVLEAMALGLPVVASDIPAHRELLGPASDGVVAATPETFATALGALVADDQARALLGAENRTRARSEFGAREMVSAIEAIYREVGGPDMAPHTPQRS